MSQLFHGARWRAEMTHHRPFIHAPLAAMSEPIALEDLMTVTLPRLGLVLAATLALGSAWPGAGSTVAGEQAVASKDQGPASARCDQVTADKAEWLSCVGAPVKTASSAELFYAGYWLAKSGAYEKALSYLKLADQSDPRVITYIGFSMRKLGHVDKAMPFYAKALTLDANYNVARAYLGEAHLTKGNVADAEDQLAQIADRCGVHCAEYIDLAGHIKAYKSHNRG